MTKNRLSRLVGGAHRGSHTLSKTTATPTTMPPQGGGDYPMGPSPKKARTAAGTINTTTAYQVRRKWGLGVSCRPWVDRIMRAIPSLYPSTHPPTYSSIHPSTSQSPFPTPPRAAYLISALAASQVDAMCVPFERANNHINIGTCVYVRTFIEGKGRWEEGRVG